MDRVVVITGASSGIGAALAELLGKQGDHVVLVARREKELNDVAQRSGDALALVADVTKREEVKQVVEKTIARFGRIDVWVNNAGRGITRMPSELSDDDVDDMIRVNVKSVLYGTQEVLPHMKEQGRGQIINISSMLGRVPWAPFRSAYSASKHFVNALTASFRDEIQKTHPDIQVTLVSPGVVRTEFGANALHGGPDSRSLPNSQSAEEVAQVIANAIDSRAADVYTLPGGKEMVVGYFQKLS